MDRLAETKRVLQRLDNYVDEMPQWARLLSIAVDSIHDHLESQKSPETPGSEASSPATASPTTDSLSGADSALPSAPTETAFITVTTRLLQQLLGTPVPVVATHVDQCSECAGHLAKFASSVSMHALGAQSTSSTSVSAGKNSSAAPESSVTSLSRGSEKCSYEWLHTDNNWYRCTYRVNAGTDRCDIHSKRDIFPDRPSLSSSSASAGGESGGRLLCVCGHSPLSHVLVNGEPEGAKGETDGE